MESNFSKSFDSGKPEDQNQDLSSKLQKIITKSVKDQQDWLNNLEQKNDEKNFIEFEDYKKLFSKHFNGMIQKFPNQQTQVQQQINHNVSFSSLFHKTLINLELKKYGGKLNSLDYPRKKKKIDKLKQMFKNNIIYQALQEFLLQQPEFTEQLDIKQILQKIKNTKILPEEIIQAYNQIIINEDQKTQKRQPIEQQQEPLEDNFIKSLDRSTINSLSQRVQQYQELQIQVDQEQQQQLQNNSNNNNKDYKKTNYTFNFLKKPFKILKFSFDQLKNMRLIERQKKPSYLIKSNSIQKLKTEGNESNKFLIMNKKISKTNIKKVRSMSQLSSNEIKPAKQTNINNNSEEKNLAQRSTDMLTNLLQVNNSPQISQEGSRNELTLWMNTIQMALQIVKTLPQFCKTTEEFSQLLQIIYFTSQITEKSDNEQKKTETQQTVDQTIFDAMKRKQKGATEISNSISEFCKNGQQSQNSMDILKQFLHNQVPEESSNNQSQFKIKQEENQNQEFCPPQQKSYFNAFLTIYNETSNNVINNKIQQNIYPQQSFQNDPKPNQKEFLAAPIILQSPNPEIIQQQSSKIEKIGFKKATTNNNTSNNELK